MNASDVLVESLIDWGVEMVFGLPGDGINGIMEALRTRQDKIRFIHVRHEETAAFMACGYAKYTGKLGVCLATSGPGGIHLLNGLYDAKLDGAPVLAITGLQFHDLIGTHTQQDVALDKLFMDVCVFNERIMGATHVENIIDLACRTAISYGGVAHITIPVDFQEKEVQKRERSKRNIPGHTSDVRTRSYKLPADSQLQQAADILNSGKKVAILAGRGALGCGEQLEQIAELLAAPIVKPLLGKAVVPDDSPYTTGSIGLLGTAPSQDVMEKCDTLLMVGTSFPYLEYLPKPDQAKGVQIDIDPMRIGLRFPVDVGLVGDSHTVLAEPDSAAEEERRSQLSGNGAVRHEGLVGVDRDACHSYGQAHEAAGGCMGTRQASAERCHRELRQRHHCYVVGARDPRQARPDAQPLRQSGDHGAGAARTPWRRSLPILTGNASPSSAMAASPC